MGYLGAMLLYRILGLLDPPPQLVQGQVVGYGHGRMVQQERVLNPKGETQEHPMRLRAEAGHEVADGPAGLTLRGYRAFTRRLALSSLRRMAPLCFPLPLEIGDFLR